MSTDALAKSLRSIVNNSPDTVKVEKAKNLLSDLECGQKHKSGNCIDKLWIKIENKYKERERTDVMCSDTGIQLANCNGVRICNFSSSGKRIYENGEGVVTQQKRTKLKSVNVSDQVDDLTDECMSTPVDDLSDSTTTSTTKNKPKYIQHDFRTKLKSANVSDQVDDLTDECMSTPVDDLSDSTTTPTTKSKPKYIQHDLAQELLTSLRLLPLKGEKWLWNGYDVCGVFQDDGNARTPLHIGVVNFHNNLCSRSLPPSMITFIQQQMENDDDDCIFFDDNRQHGITKFVIEVDKEVVEFLENFKIV
ncbi:uncharacterized protein OCT59_007202 [Rhizophagus irregularis]|uniref:uncharacterized protein n=1 Tax=Rhizophagus irregularis TaxID=588596 RepID=UPI000CC8A00F|nr:hypothetical protein OCT59_007202 [Rhizophagus irregularis]